MKTEFLQVRVPVHCVWGICSSPKITTTRKNAQLRMRIYLFELNDGSVFDEVAVEYPIGHKRQRQEGIPELLQKFKTNLA